MFSILIAVLALLLLGFMAYVRLAPADVARWHRIGEVTGPGDTLGSGSFMAVRNITAPKEEVLAAVEQRALGTPHTTLLAGSVDEGMMTFVTRTAFWGFPDYSTVAVQGDLLVVYGRLRFGRSDFGVNKARIESWLNALGPLTVPL